MSDVRTVTQDELFRKLRQVQVVNVLEPEWYALGLIPGSKTIPLAELDRRLGELDKSVEVVTYCASRQCTASSEAARKLAAKGYAASAYEGGIKEWVAAGLPVEAGRAVVAARSSCRG